MAELESAADAVIVDYLCDVCGVGRMEALDGSMLASWPPQWVHTCPSCGHKATLHEKYPKVIYRRRNDLGA